MKRLQITMACLLVLTCSGLARGEEVKYGVKARISRSATDRRLVNKGADLILDDSAHRLTVTNKEQPLTVSYDDIQKVVFDVSTHMRGGRGWGAAGVVGAIMSIQEVSDYWCYLEYKGSDGAVHPYMMEISKKSAQSVMEKMRAALGEKVSTAHFAEKAEEIQKNTLKELQSKHDLKIDKTNHPMPELKADQALVVVVCPTVEGQTANQFKLHANDHVVAVNALGTYSFAYLDPGDYLLVSQTENASGFHIRLEAGKDYYFLQDGFAGAWKLRTALSRHTKELTMYEVGGAYYSDWKTK